MDDLISRVAVLRLLDENSVVFRGEIEKLPTVDAVPVKRGLWIYFSFVGKGRYQCSECFHWVNAGIDRNYCPNCGAKMGKSDA